LKLDYRDSVVPKSQKKKDINRLFPFFVSVFVSSFLPKLLPSFPLCVMINMMAC
jgi:hypothetical protein